MDTDIATMTIDELRVKLQEIRDVAFWWTNQKGDDRCWLDDIKLLTSILPHGRIDFSMPSDLDFLQNCIRFKRTRCPISPKFHEW